MKIFGIKLNISFDRNDKQKSLKNYLENCESMIDKFCLINIWSNNRLSNEIAINDKFMQRSLLQNLYKSNFYNGSELVLKN